MSRLALWRKICTIFLRQRNLSTSRWNQLNSKRSKEKKKYLLHWSFSITASNVGPPYTQDLVESITNPWSKKELTVQDLIHSDGVDDLAILNHFASNDSLAEPTIEELPAAPHELDICQASQLTFSFKKLLSFF
jgi:hypothetical protein